MSSITYKYWHHTKKKKTKKTIVITGYSILGNIHSRSDNQSLKECFSVKKTFLGAATKDMAYI